MKSLMVKFIAGVFLVANVSYAATVSNTSISMVTIDRASGAKVFIKTSVTKPAANPACHTNTASSFVLPLANDVDKAIYSALLSAKSAGQKVNLVGTGDCAIQSGVETLNKIEVI